MSFPLCYNWKTFKRGVREGDTGRETGKGTQPIRGHYQALWSVGVQSHCPAVELCRIQTSELFHLWDQAAWNLYTNSHQLLVEGCRWGGTLSDSLSVHCVLGCCRLASATRENPEPKDAVGMCPPMDGLARVGVDGTLLA